MLRVRRPGSMVCALLTLLPVLVALTCSPFRGIVILEPRQGELETDDAVRLDASGLSVGPHDFVVQGFRPSDGVTVIASGGFSMVGPLDEKVRATTSAGLLKGSILSAGFQLGNASAGDASAGAPIAYPDGSELRAGVVETIEARLAGGTP